jgi:hypothetical protein
MLMFFGQDVVQIRDDGDAGKLAYAWATTVKLADETWAIRG